MKIIFSTLLSIGMITACSLPFFSSQVSADESEHSDCNLQYSHYHYDKNGGQTWHYFLGNNCNDECYCNYIDNNAHCHDVCYCNTHGCIVYDRINYTPQISTVASDSSQEISTTTVTEEYIECGTYIVESNEYCKICKSTNIYEHYHTNVLADQQGNIVGDAGFIVYVTTVYADVSSQESVIIDAVLLGDATNDNIVDIRDVTEISQYIVKIIELDEQAILNSDINKDGIIDIKDLSQLKKFLIKEIDKL